MVDTWGLEAPQIIVDTWKLAQGYPRSVADTQPGRGE